jgi:hypothetical protein
MFNKKRDEQRIAKLQDYKRTFGSEHGKRVLYDLMNEHYFLRSSYDSNPQEMAFREGQKNVVLRIMTALKLDQEQLKQKIEGADEYAREN